MVCEVVAEVDEEVVVSVSEVVSVDVETDVDCDVVEAVVVEVVVVLHPKTANVTKADRINNTLSCLMVKPPLEIQIDSGLAEIITGTCGIVRNDVGDKQGIAAVSGVVNDF